MKDTLLPRASYNPITILGAAIAIVAGVTGGTLLLVGFFEHNTNPYFGIFLYGVVPTFLVLGLILIPLGMWREWNRIKKGIERTEPVWPKIDLNVPRHRRSVVIFVLATSVFVVMSAVGSYKAYHFSESVEFCGTTCHEVMKPEYVAYQHSAHARVACAECHIGSGADWWAKSKISGAYQVYSVIANKYSRPIETPLRELRPAQETCEQCHWPQKFFGGQQKVFNHYMYDSANTHWPINLLIKTGGGDPKTGQSSGIHWHMNIGVKVEYIARDHDREDIPWVKITDKETGRVTVYTNNDGDTLNAQQFDSLPKRTMDCMDCHNRPSHVYPTPDETVDLGILVGGVNRSLPDIKRVSVEAMTATYATEPEAMTGIANYIGSYYEKNYPAVYLSQRLEIDKAIQSVQAGFSRSIFPEMKVNWAAYPSNLGHYSTIGCMRCHNGKLVSADQKPITTDCNACHTILSQGTGERMASSHGAEGLRFDHPVDIADAWEDTPCSECHSGVQP